MVVERNYIRKQIRKTFNSMNVFWYFGPDNSVGIATGYGLDGPGDRIPLGTRFSARPDMPWGPPGLL